MQEVTRISPERAYGMKSLVGFALEAKWFISLCAILGFLLSIGYVYFSPNKYESKSQIQMAKYVSSISEGEKTSTIGRRYVNSETVAALVQRLRYVSTYPDAVLKQCGVENTAVRADYLGGGLQVRLVPGLENNVELIFRGGSPELAKNCLEAVVSMIAEQQRRLIEESVAGVGDLLKGYNEDLRVVMAEEEGQENVRAQAWEVCERARWPMAKIDGLREELILAQTRPTKLLAPIVVSSTPVFPVPVRILALGIGLGLVLGLLLAWVRKEWQP